MECNEKMRLLVAYGAATEAYSQAVRLMTDTVAPLSSAKYDELQRGAKAARIRCEEARTELKRHGERHGCRDGMPGC